MIIGCTGPKLAGKGTFAQYLAQTKNARLFTMSTILTDIAERLHLENSRSNLIAIATGLRSQFGQDILAHVLQKDIQRVLSETSIVVIDGIRMPQEVEIFSALPQFTLVYIDAPLEQRYQRALQRGEKAGESTMTFEQFQQEEQAVTEQGIQSLQAKAATRIMNDTSFEEFYRHIDQLIHQYV